MLAFPVAVSALLLPSQGLHSLRARGAIGGLVRADDPEIDPRRKDPPSPSSPPGPGRFMPLPTVGAGDDKMAVLSRLLKDRILMLGQQVDDEVANVLVAGRRGASRGPCFSFGVLGFGFRV